MCCGSEAFCDFLHWSGFRCTWEYLPFHESRCGRGCVVPNFGNCSFVSNLFWFLLAWQFARILHANFNCQRTYQSNIEIINLVKISFIQTFNGTIVPDEGWSNGSAGYAGDEALAEVTNQLLTLFIIQGALALVCFGMTLFLFKDRPKYPPSLSEAKKRTLARTSPQDFSIRTYLKTLLDLVKTYKWIFIAMSGGMVVGVGFSNSLF